MDLSGYIRDSKSSIFIDSHVNGIYLSTWWRILIIFLVLEGCIYLDWPTKRRQPASLGIEVVLVLCPIGCIVWKNVNGMSWYTSCWPFTDSWEMPTGCHGIRAISRLQRVEDCQRDVTVHQLLAVYRQLRNAKRMSWLLVHQLLAVYIQQMNGKGMSWYTRCWLFTDSFVERLNKS